MKNSTLVFEMVGDINSTYPYLCVYVEEDRINPFMEIGVTDGKQLQYTIYACARNICLTADDWGFIQEKGKEFFPKALRMY